MIGGRVGDHGAENQGAFEAEIHAARFLRQALAKRDKHERRRDADRAAEHRDEDGDKRGVHAFVPAAGRKMAKRP